MQFTPRFVAVLLSASLAAAGACGPLDAAPERYAAPREIAEVADARIAEASGIVASRANPDWFYVHNDSGDAPRVFVLDREGATRVVLSLSGAAHVDWEDIAIAPRAEGAGWDVCIADIGDNAAQRTELVIYRFADERIEATAHGSGDGAAPHRAITPRRYRIRFADGPVDAEAFLVHPVTGDGYVFSKRSDGISDVFKLAAPWSESEINTMPRIGRLRFPASISLARIITAADISPDGLRIAARSYLNGWEWRLPDDTSARDFERIFDRTAVRIDLAVEPQGEAIGYTADGRALLTISERVPTYLYETARE